MLVNYTRQVALISMWTMFDLILYHKSHANCGTILVLCDISSCLLSSLSTREYFLALTVKIHSLLWM